MMGPCFCVINDQDFKVKKKSMDRNYVKDWIGLGELMGGSHLSHGKHSFQNKPSKSLVTRPDWIGF